MGAEEKIDDNLDCSGSQPGRARAEGESASRATLGLTGSVGNDPFNESNSHEELLCVVMEPFLHLHHIRVVV